MSVEHENEVFDFFFCLFAFLLPDFVGVKNGFNREQKQFLKQKQKYTYDITK